jgi:hypothetical protein
MMDDAWSQAVERRPRFHAQTHHADCHHPLH